jgi:CRP-like cAMP-binding protein
MRRGAAPWRSEVESMNAEELLKKVAFFEGTPAAELAAIAALAETKELIGGDCVFNAGAEADAFYVIALGTVEIRLAGRDREVASLGSGQHFGFEPFFLGGQRAATAQTTEVTRLVRVPFAGLKALLERRSDLALTLYRNAARLYAQRANALAAELQRPFF